MCATRGGSIESADVGEQLELDVVGVSEHDHDRAGEAARLGDRRVRDATLEQPSTPPLELGPVGDREREVIESGHGLVEAEPSRAAVRDETEANAELVVSEVD